MRHAESPGREEMIYFWLRLKQYFPNQSDENIDIDVTTDI